MAQFVLDELIATNQGARASIIVTQPRRLSAIGVAARVSAERLDDGSVGYAIRGESKHGPRTKILFCTTGVVLRRLGSGDKLSDVTHVIVDEVSVLHAFVSKNTHLARSTNALSTETSFFWNSESC